MEPGSSAPLLASAFFGLGAAFVVYSLSYGRARAVATRRLTTFVLVDAPADSGAPRRSFDIRPLLQRLAVTIAARSGLIRFSLIFVALVCVALGFVSGSFWWFAPAGAAAIATFFLSGKTRRQRLLEEQAPAALEMLSSGLRGGYSVSQAIALVARESPEPTATEFAIVERELALGVDLATATTRMAQRTGNDDFELVAIILTVQHETGGNLAQILDSVASTLRERFDLRRMVAALTAQQRMSSIVLTGLPVGVLIFLTLVNRSFVEPLYVQTVGRMILAMVVVLLMIGWSVMRAMGRIEV